jgi:hypothetical protein
MAYKQQDQPYGTVTIVGTAATFTDSQSGVVANGQTINVIPQGHRVVSGLSADGLTCTLVGASSVTAAGFNYSGHQSSIRG